ncbi:MAG: TetR/AcrR family transcriptional regulator [Burkholderiales bacterium]|nr:TetR/AcrR family transcriptional regulator [Burkholderiales bacterium]
MRYSKTHKEETRRKLMDSSRALVKQGGFDSTGVDALMAAIGLTSGAFYSHFPSKQALLEAVIAEEIDHSIDLLSVPPDASAVEALRRLNLYLSAAHARHPEKGCVLPALGAELGRASPEVRGIVEKGLKQLHKNLVNRFHSDEQAWAVMAQCVGALVLARAVKTDKTRNEILEANKHHIARQG